MEDINRALQKIRPALQQDGGDVEIVSFDETTGVLLVKFLGHCAGCPFAQMTLKQGIEKAVLADCPQVKRVELAC
ncbi:MAG: NifU family protein [Patescibacteria group bacterium]